MPRFFKTSKTPVLLGIDLQRDFMDPNGKLSVSGAQSIVGNIKTLTKTGEETGALLFLSGDNHPSTDPSFNTNGGAWPPHCVTDTDGQQIIPEALTSRTVTIPTTPCAVPRLSTDTQLIFEKQDYSIVSNSTFLKTLNQIENPLFIVYGVATDYCVKATVMDLRQLGYPVYVVTDAIKAVKDDSGALEQMQLAGARAITTADVPSIIATAKPMPSPDIHLGI